MIIIRMQGGIGNQLFQYALYCEYQYKGIDVCADLSLYRNGIDPRKYGLESFEIRLAEAKQKDIDRLLGIDKYRIKYLLPRFMRSRTCYYERQAKANLKLLDQDELYLIGYFQSEQYFPDVKEQLKEIIGKPVTETVQSQYYTQILQHRSVAVHVRRGDYLNNSQIYGNICTKEYYRKAIELMKEKVEDPVFYVFSDDIAGAKTLFDDEKCVYIDHSTEAGEPGIYSDIVDMQLMSFCNHNIMANSSFSWWGAWLNDKKEKIVIAPDRWMNDRQVEDIWCENWIRI